MDPHNINSSNIFALRKKLDIEQVKNVVQKDFDEANRRTESSVQQVKEDLSNVVPEVLKLCHLVDDDDEEEEDRMVRRVDATSSSPEIAQVLKHSITYMDKKAKLDAQVVRMFDKSTVEDVKSEIVQKNVDLLIEEFQRAADHHALQIQLTRRQIEDNIRKMVQLQQDELSRDMIASLPGKVLRDLEEARDKSDALTRKTREEIVSHLLVFFTNPQGTKGTEELESEALMQAQVNELEEKLLRDLLTIKKATDDVTNSTKSYLESSLRTKDEQTKLDTEDLFNFQIRPKGEYSNTVFKTFNVVGDDDPNVIDEDVESGSLEKEVTRVIGEDDSGTNGERKGGTTGGEDDDKRTCTAKCGQYHQHE